MLLALFLTGASAGEKTCTFFMKAEDNIKTYVADRNKFKIYVTGNSHEKHIYIPSSDGEVTVYDYYYDNKDKGVVHYTDTKYMRYYSEKGNLAALSFETEDGRMIMYTFECTEEK
jgi:hypothetical protein